MGEWIETTLGDFLTLQRGFDLPVTDRAFGKYPVIASTGPVGYHNQAMVKGPGVVIGRSGSIGGGQFIQSDFWPLNTTLWVKDFKGNDVRFSYYLLRSIDFSGFNTGSGVPTLNRNHIHPLDVCVPMHVDDQVVVSSLLGALDDKIELNRQTNDTLETLARAIFKDWFVDFGPTRAKAEGQEPYLVPELWGLFPDALDDEDKLVGWVVGSPLDLANLISGGTPKTSEPKYWDGEIAWASAKDVSTCGQTFLLDTERKITDSGLKNSSTRIVPALSTVVVARGATTGRFCMFGVDIAMNQTCYALRAKDDFHYFLNCWFDNQVGNLVHSGHGSVFNTITTKTFQSASTLIPPLELREAFNRSVTALFELIRANLFESTTLAQTRDLLLPKLMSGEIRLREAERIVEEVI